MTATYKDHLALVTGANKGLGRATARRLGALGMTVLIGSRDPGRGAETVAELVEHGLDARLLVLDVTDESSVRAAATSIGRNHGRLDVLVNNAGIASPRRAPLEITADDMRLVYGTNVFGVVTVTRLMLPLLERAAHPRIVMVSSGLASLGPDSPYARYISVAYGSSKTALNAVTVQYANALRDRYPKLRINAADPGHCATDLNGWTGPRTAEQGAEIIVRLACVPDDGPTGRFFDENGPVAW